LLLPSLAVPLSPWAHCVARDCRPPVFCGRALGGPQAERCVWRPRASIEWATAVCFLAPVLPRAAQLEPGKLIESQQFGSRSRFSRQTGRPSSSGARPPSCVPADPTPANPQAATLLPADGLLLLLLPPPPPPPPPVRAANPPSAHQSGCKSTRPRVAATLSEHNGLNADRRNPSRRPSARSGGGGGGAIWRLDFLRLN